MNYKLAKQLKDAGFPQHNIGRALCPCRNRKAGNERVDYCIPTLSELIDACGNDDFELTRFNKKWCARMLNEHKYGIIYGFGKTPEEAVAKLYLKLCQKESSKE